MLLLPLSVRAQDFWNGHSQRHHIIVKKTSYERHRASNHRYQANHGRNTNHRYVSRNRRSSNYDHYSNYEYPNQNYYSNNRYAADDDNDTNKEANINRAPFASKIANRNLIKVDLGKLAWGAYDDEGNLVKWGRASGGKNYCSDIKRGCKTITGTFTIYRKQGPECKSNRFPVGKGGAPMPYCMHFHGAYAMHGGQVPNYNASHGCVRLLRQDAQWLNEDFVNVGRTRVNITY
jgi:hypothetical protein